MAGLCCALNLDSKAREQRATKGQTLCAYAPTVVRRQLTRAEILAVYWLRILLVAVRTETR